MVNILDSKTFIKQINRLSDKILKRKLKLNQDMPLDYLIGILVQRTNMLIRGVSVAPLFNKCGSPLFIGKHVTVRCKSKIVLGNCVTFQDYVYIDALSKEGIFLGNNVSIGMRTIIKTSGSLGKLGKGFKIGANSAMGNDCFIGAAGGVEIGEYCAIGQNVRFHSENHKFDNPNKPIHEQGVINKGIKVGNDCWIGAGAVLLDGVTIGNSSVIGANSVVCCDVPDFSVFAGNPAKLIKKRK